MDYAEYGGGPGAGRAGRGGQGAWPLNARAIRSALMVAYQAAAQNTLAAFAAIGAQSGAET